MRSERAIPIDISYLNDRLRRATLTDRLDFSGTEEIVIRFAAAETAGGRRVVVDMTAVSFLGSIGIRALISDAKALQANGGRMVPFVGCNEMVAKTLQAIGIDALIPMFADAAVAETSAPN